MTKLSSMVDLFRLTSVQQTYIDYYIIICILLRSIKIKKNNKKLFKTSIFGSNRQKNIHKAYHLISYRIGPLPPIREGKLFNQEQKREDNERSFSFDIMGEKVPEIYWKTPRNQILLKTMHMHGACPGGI